MKKAIKLNTLALFIIVGNLFAIHFISARWGDGIGFVFGFFALILFSFFIKINLKIGYEPFKKIRKNYAKYFFSIIWLIPLAILLNIAVNPLVNFWIIQSNISLSLQIHPVKVNIVVLIYALLIAPLLEELVFRNFLLKKTFDLTSFKWLSILISSFLFALIHLPSVTTAVCAFFLGIVCSILFLETKEITVSIIFHSSYNLITVLLGDVFFGNYLKFISMLDFNYLYWTICFGALGLFIPILMYYLRQKALS